jgi:acyl carrier protein
MTDIERDIIRIVSAVTKSPVDTIGLDTDLRVDLNIDSLQGLRIMAAIEKRFAIQVPDDDLDLYTSVRVMAAAVARLQGAGSRAV